MGILRRIIKRELRPAVPVRAPVARAYAGLNAGRHTLSLGYQAGAAAMDALEAILTRSSVPPVKMGPPGPDDAQLRRILEAGAAAPDHGRLRPWRFLVVRGAARERLGELFASAALAKGGEVSEAEVEKQRSGPLRAPVVVTVAAKVRPDHPKIPPAEQVASAAAAAQNMLIAAHALGLSAKWTTGKNAHDPAVRDGMGLGPDDQIVGFLLIGSPAVPHGAAERPPVDDVVVEWEGRP
jgi:nitroreductase